MTLFDISTSALKDTVWVAGPDGSCLGRFSKKFGLDVHTSAEAQLDGAAQCLYCTHSPAGPEDWKIFRAKMLEHHGIEVPENFIVFAPPQKINPAKASGQWRV